MASNTDIQVNINAQNNSSKAFNDATKNVKKLEDQVKDTDSFLKKHEESFKRVGIAAGIAFTAISGEVYAAVSAFTESQKQLNIADNYLDNLSNKTLKQFSGGLDQAKQIAREFGAEMQKIGGIADEEVTIAFSRLLQQTEDSSTAMDAVSIAADLATQKQIDLGTATDIVSKVLSGNTSILTRYGIAIEEGATATEAMTKLQSMFGGAYEKSGKTIAGQMKILKESFGDLQESIGGALVPVLTMVLEKLQPVIEKITQWVSEHPKLTAAILLTAAAVTGLVAGISALALAVIAFQVVAAPVILVILAIVAAIGALVAIGVYLYKNWDEMQNSFMNVWNTIYEFAQSVFGKISDAFTRTWEQIKSYFKAAVDFLYEVGYNTLALLLGSIITLLDTFFPGWQEAIIRIKDAIVAVFESIKSVVMSVWNSTVQAISAALTWLWETIIEPILSRLDAVWSSVWNGISDVFTTVWNTITTTIQKAIDAIVSGIDRLLSALNKVSGPVTSFLGKVGGSIASGFSSVIATGQAALSQHRASGGPVTAGSPYIVGEQGPEAFVPSSNGTIIPNHALSGVGGITINITGNTLLDQSAGQKIGDQIMKTLRTNLRI